MIMSLRNISVVCYRNLVIFRRGWLASLFWITLEPILYLVAFGLGVGKLVDDVKGMTYLEYYYPGRLINTAMLITYYEGTFPVMGKFINQHTYLSMSFSSLRTNEICLGEIAWTTLKGLLAVLTTILVSSFVGLGAFRVVYSLPIIVIHCWIFASLAIMISSQSERSKTFSHASVGIMLPLSLFTGAFFPLENLPYTLDKFFNALPPAQALHLIRVITHGSFGKEHFPNILALLFYLGISTFACLKLFKKRIHNG